METGEYERIREQNIREKEAMLKSLLLDINGFLAQEKLLPQAPKSAGRKPAVKREYVDKPTRKYLSRSFSPRIRYNTRLSSTSSSICSSVPSSPERLNGDAAEKLIVKFPFHDKICGEKPLPLEVFEEDNNWDYSGYELMKPKRTVYVRKRLERELVAASDISPHQLKLVASVVSEKEYDPYNGSTCHQCRQKTKDTKTICRAEGCVGVRGKFCGPCLKNRYGEDAKEALMDPDWICPPCRGICNCSFCRKKKGRNCTGILIHEAKENGYQSVKEYLESVVDD